MTLLVAWTEYRRFAGGTIHQVVADFARMDKTEQQDFIDYLNERMEPRTYLRFLEVFIK